MELDEIKYRISSNKMPLSEALATALPKFRGLADDNLLFWCVNELQGYNDGLNYYQEHAHNLPQYRVVQGRLAVVMPDGNWAQINHALAQRGQYFLSAPVQWLEDFAAVQGDDAIVDLPELTNFIGRQMGGTVICATKKTQLVRILDMSKQSFMSALEHVIKLRNERFGAPQQQAWSDMADFSAPSASAATPTQGAQSGSAVQPPPATPAQDAMSQQNLQQQPQPVQKPQEVAPQQSQAQMPQWRPAPTQQQQAPLKPGAQSTSFIGAKAAPEPPKSLVPEQHSQVEDPETAADAPAQQQPGKKPEGGEMNVKRRSMQLMQQAYGTQDKVLPLTSLHDQAERDVVVDYLLRMRWIKQLKQAGVYSLSKEGLKEVETSLNF